MPSGRRRAASLALLVALGALLYLPSLATQPFHGEESRRAIPARGNPQSIGRSSTKGSGRC